MKNILKRFWVVITFSITVILFIIIASISMSIIIPIFLLIWLITGWYWKYMDTKIERVFMWWMDNIVYRFEKL